MKKELYLYGSIYTFTAEDLISKMDECGGEDISLRICSGGGDVFAGWGIAAKMSELGNVCAKVDGMAASMSAFLLMYAESVECIDSSTFMLHRAIGYDTSAEGKALVDTVNKSLRSKMEAKLDSKTLKELKGVSIKDLFESEERIDLFLSAKEAKKIGLVDKINKVDPVAIKAFNERMFNIAAKIEEKPDDKSKPPITMTLTEIKAQHPKVYDEIFAAGVAQEKDRVEAALVFMEIDPVGVKAVIESGKPLSTKETAEFALKAMSKPAIEAIKKDAEGNIITAAVDDKIKTEKEKVLSAYEIQVRKSLGLKVA